jgi:hypothetical protein
MACMQHLVIITHCAVFEFALDAVQILVQPLQSKLQLHLQVHVTLSPSGRPGSMFEQQVMVLLLPQCCRSAVATLEQK